MRYSQWVVCDHYDGDSLRDVRSRSWFSLEESRSKGPPPFLVFLESSVVVTSGIVKNDDDGYR